MICKYCKLDKQEMYSKFQCVSCKKQKINSYRKEWRSKPENKIKNYKYMSGYRSQNKDKISKSFKKWQEQHVEERRDYQKEFRNTHIIPLKTRYWRLLDMSKKRNISCSITESEYYSLLNNEC